jgi:hypothetical protein
LILSFKICNKENEATYILHLFRICASEIFEGSPFSKAELGKDGNVVPTGPFTAMWKVGVVIVVLKMRLK